MSLSSKIAVLLSDGINKVTAEEARQHINGHTHNESDIVDLDKFTQEEVTNAIQQAVDSLKDSVSLDGDSLNKLNEKIVELQSWKATLSQSDVDNVVNTLNDLFSLFEGAPEGINVMNELQNKVDKIAGKSLSTNDFTDGEKLKLAGIEEGAKNFTDESIKTSYESNSNTNAFTDLEKAKLESIAYGATQNLSNTLLRQRDQHTGTQAISTIQGLQYILDNKEDSIIKNTAFNKDFGSVEGSVVEGNDQRLGTKAINETEVSDGKVLVYRASEDALLYENPDDLGEKNTAVNIGTGVGLFKQKTLEILEVKTVKSISNKITISALDNEVHLGFDESQLSLNNFLEKSYNSLEDKPFIPERLLDLTDSPTSRLVTDAEKGIWNAKSNLALGETNLTAFRGDKGKIAFEHAFLEHAPSDAQKNVQPNWLQGDVNSDEFIKNKPSIIDNAISTSATDVLSANQGRELQSQFDSLKNTQGNHDRIDWSHIQGIPEVTYKNYVIVKSFYDPTDGLPENPLNHDQYISSAEANTWKKDYVYKWSEKLNWWIEQQSFENQLALVQDDGDGKQAQYAYNGEYWVKVGDVDWQPDNAESIKSKYESNPDTNAFTDDYKSQLDNFPDISNVTNDSQLKREANDFNSFPIKNSPTQSDIILIEDSEDNFEKKTVTRSKLLQDISNFKNSQTYYVSKQGNNLNTGSFLKPWETIQHALDNVPPLSTIYIQEGSYTENIAFTSSVIVRAGIQNGVTLNGNITFSATNQIFTVIEGLNVESLENQDCFITTGNGGIRFHNCKFKTYSINDLAYNISGGLTSNIVFNECSVYNGGISLQVLNGLDVQIHGGYYVSPISINIGSVLIIRNAMQIGPITHSGGVISISHVDLIVKDSNSDSLISNADLNNGNLIFLQNTGLKQADLSFGKINKTGSCYISLSKVIRSPQIDILQGAVNFDENSEDIKANYTPENYIGSTSIQSHLQGIDDAFAFKVFVSLQNHSLLVGDIVRSTSSGSYIKSKADLKENAIFTGIISEVIDQDSFYLQTFGAFTPNQDLKDALAVQLSYSSYDDMPNGKNFFLSPLTEGVLQEEEPEISNQYIIPVLQKLTNGQLIVLSQGCREQVLKHNLTAGSNPTSINNSSEGYAPTSKWINIVNQEIFECVQSSNSFATWKNTTASTVTQEENNQPSSDSDLVFLVGENYLEYTEKLLIPFDSISNLSSYSKIDIHISFTGINMSNESLFLRGLFDGAEYTNSDYEYYSSNYYVGTEYKSYSNSQDKATLVGNSSSTGLYSNEDVKSSIKIEITGFKGNDYPKVLFEATHYKSDYFIRSEGQIIIKNNSVLDGLCLYASSGTLMPEYEVYGFNDKKEPNESVFAKGSMIAEKADKASLAEKLTLI